MSLNTDIIQLREITPDNFEDVLKLKVKNGQESYVSTTAYALAQALAFRDSAYPFAIYAGETCVGFIMFGFYKERDQHTLWKFMIDERYQGLGYGKAALISGIEKMKAELGFGELYTGVVLGNSVAEGLYTSLGFEPTGLVENGMRELRYICR